MILVVDASVAIAWIATDERSAYADAALEACGSDPAVVPALWYWEIANTLSVFERKGRLNDAVRLYESLLEYIPFAAESVIDRKARGIEELRLAKIHALTIYDAAYLATAKSTNVTLATLDTRLAKAAKAEQRYFSP